jgi:hypothetical protein
MKVQKSGPGARAGRVPLRWSRRCVPVAAPPVMGAAAPSSMARASAGQPGWIAFVPRVWSTALVRLGCCVSVCVCVWCVFRSLREQGTLNLLLVAAAFPFGPALRRVLDIGWWPSRHRHAVEPPVGRPEPEGRPPPGARLCLALAIHRDLRATYCVLPLWVERASPRGPSSWPGCEILVDRHATQRFLCLACGFWFFLNPPNDSFVYCFAPEACLTAWGLRPRREKASGERRTGQPAGAVPRPTGWPSPCDRVRRAQQPGHEAGCGWPHHPLQSASLTGLLMKKEDKTGPFSFCAAAACSCSFFRPLALAVQIHPPPPLQCTTSTLIL